LPHVSEKSFIPILILGVLAVAAGVALRWADQNTHFKIPDYVTLPAFIIVLVLGCYLVYSKKWDVVGTYVSKLLERVLRRF